jgi:DsbC/DsbD-like thiol-disulfide interchange protein/cytochrome c biogenesis protein CcdA
MGKMRNPRNLTASRVSHRHMGRFATLRKFACLLALVLVPATHAIAQVRATLVAAETSVQPGRPVTVALRLVHDEHWHTYWKNPGTGLPTEIAWTLPEGWTARPIQWPAPIPIKDSTGAITGNGYDGDLLLPVTLTPPADLAVGTNVELTGTASWLMCADVCIPGSAPVGLSLQVAAAPPAADPDWGARIGAVIDSLPRDVADWTVEAFRENDLIALSISPASGTTGVHQPQDLYLFSEDTVAAYDKPQRVRPNAQGGYNLVVPFGFDAPPDAFQIAGVLTSENGWNADGSLRGFAFSTALLAPPPGFMAALTAPEVPERGIGLTVGLALLGGLILNLMPCVFPVLGLKVLGFVNQAGSDSRKVVMHGVIFTAGVLASFWALAGLLAALRQGGTQLGWGFQLQSPAFVFGIIVVLMVFAMNLSGVFEFGLRATSIGGSLQTRAGYGGSFFTGVLATLVATPCSAPFLAPALGAALALPTGQSFAVFTAVGIGLSAPYLVLSAYPRAVRMLPRPGAWMETFKQFMAFPLYATVAFLLWVLAGQVAEDQLLDTLIGLTVVASGVWLYGRFHAPGSSIARARLGTAGLAVLAASGLWLAWPPSAEEARNAVAWEDWSPESVAQLRAEGRIVYVDFTARWCTTCQANKKIVFASDEVRQALADLNVATLKADWTLFNPSITAALEQYGRSAVPLNLVWLPGRNEPIILPELLTPGIVLDAIHGES